MNEFFVKKANGMLRYHDFPGEQTPILFIHGLGCASSFDYPQVATQGVLKKHRCILVDLLGAGYSDKPDNSVFTYTVNEHAEYLAAFVSSLGLESFILFGHSLGGAVALSLAAKCREKISRIILSEANLDKSSLGSTSKYIADFDMYEFQESEFRKLIQESKASGNQMWAAALSSWSSKATYLISKSAAKGEEPSWREILYSLSCPKTFIFGEQSLPDSDLDILSAHNINIEIIKNAGHSMAWENPIGLATAISNGIQQKEPTIAIIDNVPTIDKLESIKSLQSTIRKLENALSQMTQKGANTTLVKKRLNAVNIGLAILEHVWNQKPHNYTPDDLAEACDVLMGLTPSVEASYAKSKDGSPQRTLLKRRLKALELAVQALDELKTLC